MELRDGKESIGLMVMSTLSTSNLQVILKINRCKIKHKEIFYNKTIVVIHIISLSFGIKRRD